MCSVRVQWARLSRCLTAGPFSIRLIWGLGQSEPAADNLLWNTVLAVDQVPRVFAVGPRHEADVLGCEGVPELLGIPKLGRHIRRSPHQVTRFGLTSGALVVRVVTSKACPAPAAVTPRRVPVHALA
jgi:hypothetical protein